MEHSHRDQLVVRLFEETEARLKALLGVGDAYRVLFLPGGATLQFSQVPMNLLDGNGTAAYLTTGAWSQKRSKRLRSTAMLSKLPPPKNQILRPCQRANHGSYRPMQDIFICVLTRQSMVWNGLGR